MEWNCNHCIRAAETPIHIMDKYEAWGWMPSIIFKNVTLADCLQQLAVINKYYVRINPYGQYYFTGLKDIPKRWVLILNSINSVSQSMDISKLITRIEFYNNDQKDSEGKKISNKYIGRWENRALTNKYGLTVEIKEDKYTGLQDAIQKTSADTHETTSASYTTTIKMPYYPEFNPGEMLTLHDIVLYLINFPFLLYCNA
jgi:hypothetical protein